MAAISTIIAGVGLAVGAAGAAASYQGQQQQAKQIRAENAERKKMMNLSAMRSSRNALRQQMVASGMALNNAANSGTTGSSGLYGGLAQVFGETGNTLSGISQSQQSANKIFGYGEKASGYGSMASFGAGLSSLGGAMVKETPTLSKLWDYAIG